MRWHAIKDPANPPLVRVACIGEWTCPGAGPFMATDISGCSIALTARERRLIIDPLAAAIAVSWP